MRVEWTLWQGGLAGGAAAAMRMMQGAYSCIALIKGVVLLAFWDLCAIRWVACLPRLHMRMMQGAYSCIALIKGMGLLAFRDSYAMGWVAWLLRLYMCLMQDAPVACSCIALIKGILQASQEFVRC